MLRAHFLNVGHGDCTLISHPSGRLTMVDINNSQDYDSQTFAAIVAEAAQSSSYASLLSGLGGPSGSNLLGIGALAPANPLLGLAPAPPVKSILEQYAEAAGTASREIVDPIAFLKTHYPGQRLWRFVLTHPDLDHMRGLKNLYYEIGFDNFWDTDHTKSTPVFRGQNSSDKEDWNFYQSLRSGAFGFTPRYYTQGDSLFAFGRDVYGNLGGDNIEILSPTPTLVRECNNAGRSNDLSLVLRVSHAGKSILLPGDAEDAAWDSMVGMYGRSLKSTFLKASHHGRDSGYHLQAVQLICPVITFVSVGRKPDTDASSKYRNQCARVASTRYHGNIEVRIMDDGSYQWVVERNPG